MRIADGSPESHETPLPLDASGLPAVASATATAPSGMEQGGVRDLTGERLSQLAASAADATAAMHAGMSADADRRGRYAVGMSPLGPSYGDDMALPEYGTAGTVAGSWFDPPRSGASADTG
jgi:hypothetical protein